MVNKFFQFLKDLWYSLPHQLQAAIVVFAAAVGSALGDSISQGITCFSSACIKHELGAAVGAGVVALRAFYLRPGPGPQARTNEGVRRTDPPVPADPPAAPQS